MCIGQWTYSILSKILSLVGLPVCTPNSTVGGKLIHHGYYFQWLFITGGTYIHGFVASDCLTPEFNVPIFFLNVAYVGDYLISIMLENLS